ncbi:MAG TPA: phosphate regulon sensor histidine kinase PhoR [Gallionellaceae bacterium]|nr:phosphate regulon sensor histidine kinase PhoR [Gallionellaceae bacterium]
MTGFWPRTLLLLLLLALPGLAAWAAFGPVTALLLLGAGLLALVLMYLRYLTALERWLEDPEIGPAPEGMGAWGDIFSRLNKMVKTQVRDRERRIAALQEMQEATSALPEGVVILDDTDHIEWCNPLAEQHFGLDHERDAGQQITYLARQPEFIGYLEKQSFEQPLVLRGSRLDSQMVLSIKIVAYGKNRKLLISRDITHYERAEAMRRDFVANVSHELRTPLTVVNGFIETLADMPNLENDMARHALRLMSEQTYRMNHLVDDLLTLSTLENDMNTLQEETVDVPRLMKTLQQEGASLSNQRHALELKLESSFGLSGNTRELHSAFSNLVSNAIRYTPVGGTIILRWYEQDGQPVFSVQDSGIGISPQHLPRITERFYRVDRSRSRETGGTGLGLAIVKHVANRHQAHLEIESEEGRGSTFGIVFPEKRRVALPAKAAAKVA